MVTAPTPAVIASAKADLAVLLTKQFQDDINQLRDALDSANQLVALLKTENATLKGALKETNESYDFDANIPPVTRARNGAPESERSGLLRPPPEGTIFSNGGACGRKDGGKGNRQLMQQLNRWTQAHGYKVKIFRSKPSGTKLKLVISCIYSGTAKDVTAARRAEEELERARALAALAPPGFHSGFHSFSLTEAPVPPPQAQAQPQPEGDPQVPAKKPRKKMTPRRKDCPMRFYLQELVAGSGTFVVRHSEQSVNQRCNHEPNVVFAADAEASTQSPGQEEQPDADADADEDEDDEME
ncbi:hypothetical protein INS49_012327 [Diaporthe citri]|uniref:uncharacterized protein n=1 Tax=Diaporthe citri TaxID=83186 RepID=UPI001C814FF9|nr:uncharacterized protein INS49_012327 [Diaporthe citri]KAG6358808.1 hypothetical protein INS49_012327 [Diaporthe citri]